MAFLIIFTCLGGFAGAWLMYGDSGWVIGALLGFVTTKLLQLNTRFGRLERELRLLQGQVSLKAAAAVTAPAVAQAPAEKPVAMSNTAELEFDLPLEALAPLPPADVIQPAPQPSSAPQRPSPWESNNNISRNKPAVPAGPSSLNKAVELVHNFFTQGNPIVRLGMVIMFFGLSFFVK